MSTTHPTNFTTEWDDLQRKYGNLPKLEVPETNEVRDARLVEVAEHELLREARLQAWKKKVMSRAAVTFGVPVAISEETFVREVTDASKAYAGPSGDGVGDSRNDALDEEDAADGEPRPDLLSTAGQYIPVLLLDDRKEAAYLSAAWDELARRHPTVKFTVGSVSRVLRCEGKKATAPSSLLLYFGGKCIMQKSAAAVLHGMTYDFADSTVESRIADALAALLNSVSGHGAFLRPQPAQVDSDSDSGSDEDGRRALRSAGRAFKNDFLSQISGGKVRRDRSSDSESDREASGKTYTSWVFDRAFK
ncbi:phosducin-like protein, putative [Babesia caballi]|uniref:Phosducin-like protein, putative n=1 Tax=Babesia caballi TaxID=5871 RepID=A0AAV4LXE0_BABCB|nr:phosducin-like protein, putative [Babesia caballi]